MLTVEQTYPAVVPGAQTAKGTGFEGHAFFEASSIRKVGDKYYFIYSSELSHELCYAVSDSPCRGFVYGGTLVDNADLGLCDTARYFTGNNHGSIEQINGRWYVFYHRHTRRWKSQQADRTALPCRLSNCVNCPPMPPVTCI